MNYLLLTARSHGGICLFLFMQEREKERMKVFIRHVYTSVIYLIALKETWIIINEHEEAAGTYWSKTRLLVDTKSLFQGTNLPSSLLQDGLSCHLATQRPCVISGCFTLSQKKRPKNRRTYVHFFMRMMPSIFTHTHWPAQCISLLAFQFKCKCSQIGLLRDAEAKIIWRSDELYILIKQPRRITPIQPFPLQ